MILKGHKITAEQVRAAASAYSQMMKISSGEIPVSQKFMVEISGQVYPPKKILSIASGLPVSGFSGGSAINNGLTKVGFTIVSYSK